MWRNRADWRGECWLEEQCGLESGMLTEGTERTGRAEGWLEEQSGLEERKVDWRNRAEGWLEEHSGLESGRLTGGTERTGERKVDWRNKGGDPATGRHCCQFCRDCFLPSNNLHCVVLIQRQGADSFCRSQQVLRRQRNSPHFISTNCSLPHSQEPLTWTCPKQINTLHASSSHLHIIPHLRLGCPSCLFSSCVHNKTLCEFLCSIRATWPTNLIICDLFNTIIFVGGYRPLRSSICSFLHSPVTSSFLGPKFYSAPYSQTLSSHISLWNWQTKFHTHTKQQTMFHFRIFNIYVCGYKLQDTKSHTEW